MNARRYMDGSDVVGGVSIDVTDEVMAQSRGAWRRAVRDALRDRASEELGGPAQLDRFRVDPFERHGVFAAPRARPGSHVVQARFRAAAG